MKDERHYHAPAEPASDLQFQRSKEKRPNYPLRRAAAAAGVLALSALFVKFGHEAVEHIKAANVSIAVDEERVEKTLEMLDAGIPQDEVEKELGVRVYTVEPGGNLTNVADRYLNDNAEELRKLKASDVIEALAGQVPDVDLVTPGQRVVLEGFDDQGK